MLHKLEIAESTIKLDGFELKGVTEYQLKDSVGELAELSLKMSLESKNITVKKIEEQASRQVYIVPLARKIGSILNSDVAKLVIINEKTKEEIVVITNSETPVTTADGYVAVVTPKYD